MSRGWRPDPRYPHESVAGHSDRVKRERAQSRFVEDEKKSYSGNPNPGSRSMKGEIRSTHSVNGGEPTRKKPY